MYRLARLHGRFIYTFNRGRRRAVAGNLAQFADDAPELKRMTRRFFEYKQMRVLMLLVLLEMRPDEREQHFEIEGLEHLDQALSEGKGAIFLASHLNSIGAFMAIMILRQRGYDVRVGVPSEADLYGPTLVGRLVRRASRKTTLMEQIGGFYLQFNVRPLVKLLAKNVVIVQTGDGWHSAAFANVPFLGRSLPFTTGMMSVAQGTGAMVVPFNIVGEPPNLRCAISLPFRVPADGDQKRELVAAVARYAKGLEEDLLENILGWEHWLIEDTLETMADLPERSLQERYEV
jgi:lauroyl/myristoyl acyltransferase